jgi:Zn-dependent peptidase ImmA (M78 family)
MAQALRLVVRRRCERIALEARASLALAAMDPLDPRALAEHLDIEAVSLEAFRIAHPDAVEQLTEKNPDAFFGALVPFGDRQVIVYNPAHPPHGQRFTVCHELAHLLLGHKPVPPFDRNLKRRFNPIDEAEADYLAGALLVPLIAATPALERSAYDLAGAAKHFGVSRQLMQARLVESRPRPPIAEPGDQSQQPVRLRRVRPTAERRP